MGEKIPKIRMPTEEELRESSERWWAFGGPTFYDQWSPELKALSSPTTMISIDPSRLHELFGFFEHHCQGSSAYLDDLMRQLDAAMDWQSRFVRLNSRSPKDVTYPELPITCAGRQALAWLFSSERTFDDLVRFSHLPAERGASVLLREWTPYQKKSELRTFIKDGKLIGGSVYHYNDVEIVECWKDGGHAKYAEYGEQALAYVREKVMPACGLPSFVADVAISGRRGLELIEINPYGSSDPCLFGSYHEIENWLGGIRTAPTDEMREEIDRLSKSEDECDDDPATPPVEVREIAQEGGAR